jgi:phosphate transport system substrate-binding protein
MNAGKHDSRRRLLAALAGAAACWPLAGRALRPFDAGADLCRSRAPQALPASSAPRAGELVFQGTHILAYGAMRELAERYATGGGRMIVHGGGCDDGIVAVRRGSADFGGLCCPVKGSSAEGLPWLPVARDLKAVVAHPSNPVAAIGLAELREVARGRIPRWKALGGEDRPIALVIRRHCPDYFEPVRDALLKNRPDWSPQGLFVDTDEQIVDTVSRFAGGLGLVSWVFARPLAEAGRLKVLALDGLTPAEGVRRGGGYALEGPLVLIYRQWERVRMAPFLDFLYGAEGQRIVGRSLIPIGAREAGYRRGGFVTRA